MSEHAFLKAFFRAVTDQPLEAGDERYVNLYGERALLKRDPVELLAKAIEFSPGQSVQLLSGFRGTGKSTELKKLESRLVQEGYKVVLLDMERHINTSTPIDVSDFLMAIAGAFGEALTAPEHLGKDMRREGYWERLVVFLTQTRITLPDVSAAGIKANLKSDPSFRQELQTRMVGHLGALVADIHAFIEDGVKALKERHGDETQIVLLVDSVEKIRGSYLNSRQVQESIETLFSAHADKLRLPFLHVVYIVPPYLKVRVPNLGMLYGTGAVPVFPAIKVREGDGGVHVRGLEAIRQVVARRGDYRRLLGSVTQLDKVILTSGGNIRDLLRLLSEIIRRASTLPVGEDVIDDAINQMRTEFLPIADSDAVWLAHIARTHEASFDDMEKLPDLARFFDTHLVLCYRDGPEWYDVHPLIRDIVIKQAQGIAARAAQKQDDGSSRNPS